MNSGYTPFDKSFFELQPNDLLVLKKVHEGWYVDYKVAPLNTRGYAKAISAMANTYGGWIFIGVQEESRNHNVAGALLGVNSEQSDIICQNIRQSVMEHLNPQPFFEIRSITSPEAEVGEKIICLHVPSSPKAPIIHSDGRIYRRINDASEPVAENNRNVVEHLLKRVDQFESFYKNWFDRDPELSEAEDGVTYLRLIALCDYWEEEKLWLEESAKDFVKLLTTHSDGATFSMEYNNFFTQKNGFVCRCVNTDNAKQITGTLLFWRDLRSEFWLPLPSFNVNYYSTYNNRCDELDELVNYLFSHGHGNSTVLDLSQAFGAIDGFFALNRKFQQHLGYAGDTQVKFKLRNAWRRIPALALKPDELGWNKYGVPIILHETIASLASGKVETFETVNLHKKSDITYENLFLSAPFFIKFLHSIGLGVGSFDGFAEIAAKSMKDAFDRATKKSHL